MIGRSKILKGVVLVAASLSLSGFGTIDAKAQTMTFCGPSIFGGVDYVDGNPGMMWLWDQWKNSGQNWTPAEWQKQTADANKNVFVQGFTYRYGACGPVWDNKPKSTPGYYSEPSQKGWACKKVTGTYTCDSAVMSDHAACARQSASYIKAHPLKANQAYVDWRSDIGEVKSILLTCDPVDDVPVEVTPPSNKSTEISVEVEMPKIPKYSRDGEKLDKAFDDFTVR